MSDVKLHEIEIDGLEVTVQSNVLDTLGEPRFLSNTELARFASLYSTFRAYERNNAFTEAAGVLKGMDLLGEVMPGDTVGEYPNASDPQPWIVTVERIARVVSDATVTVMAKTKQGAIDSVHQLHNEIDLDEVWDLTRAIPSEDILNVLDAELKTDA